MKVAEFTLVDQLKSGSSTAYRNLIAQFQGRVFNTCLGFVHHRGEAEDLTQEVFLEVFRSINRFKGDSKLSTWIYRISVTKSLEQIRKQSRKKRSGNVCSLADLNEKGFDVSGDRLDHPGLQMENKDRARALFGAISSLPENQRVAFTLNKIDGRSYQEVAEVMQTSLGAVESLIFRARKSLRLTLAEFYKTHG